MIGKSQNFRYSLYTIQNSDCLTSFISNMQVNVKSEASRKNSGVESK